MHFKKYSNSLHLHSLSFSTAFLHPHLLPLSFSHLPLCSLFPPVSSLSPSILLHLYFVVTFPPFTPSSPFPSISFSAFLVLSSPLPPPPSSSTSTPHSPPPDCPLPTHAPQRSHPPMQSNGTHLYLPQKQTTRRDPNKHVNHIGKCT